LLLNPLFSALVFVNITAIFSIIGGFALIVMAFQVKKLKKTIS